MIALQRLLAKLARPILPLFMAPMQFVSSPQRVLGISLPRRAGAFVFVMLGVLAGSGIFLAWAALEQLGRNERVIVLATIASMVILTPIVVEYMVKTWLDHDASEFPDIDEAWVHGLAKLREAALSLGDLPLFLVLGAPDDAQSQSLMGASTLNLTVNLEPAGEGAALRWFAGPDAAVLFLPTAGCLSRLAVKAGEPPTEIVSPMQGVGTMAPPLDEPGRRVSRTVEIPESFSFERSAMSQVPRSVMSSPAPPTFMGGIGTLTPDFGDQTSDQPFGGAPPGAPVARRFVPVTLTKAEAETATARLEHICRLLLKERLPLCPINGVLLMLPFELIARGEQEASDLCNSVRSDLATLRTQLRLRSQVIALFGGMEHTDGFPELMRRLGPKVANEQQFGKGYNPRCAPDSAELSAVARHACGAFEDWTYFLLAKRDAQRSNPRGNRQLYSLVCRIRSLQQRIEHVIVNGFSSDGASAADLPQFFSGCYFAATGDQDDRRAFVTGVFKNRLLAQDSVVEWTDESLDENDWYSEIANLFVLADIALIGTIVTLLVKWWK